MKLHFIIVCVREKQREDKEMKARKKKGIISEISLEIFHISLGSPEVFKASLASFGLTFIVTF